MDCLRSAKFTVSFSETFVFGSSSFSLRVSPGGVSLSVDLNSKFEIQGFKNIDVYGIKFIPQSSLADLNYYTVGDPITFIWENEYDVVINLDGDKDLIGGKNVLSGTVVQSSKDYILNNYANEVFLADPLKSCKNIDFGNFRATYGLTYASSLVPAGHTLILNIKGDLYLYYKFEGE